MKFGTKAKQFLTPLADDGGWLEIRNMLQHQTRSVWKLFRCKDELKTPFKEQVFCLLTCDDHAVTKASRGLFFRDFDCKMSCQSDEMSYKLQLMIKKSHKILSSIFIVSALGRFVKQKSRVKRKIVPAKRWVSDRNK